MEATKKPKRISIERLSYALMAYNELMKRVMEKAEEPLRGCINVKLLMSFRDFSIRYIDSAGSNTIGIIIKRRVAGYYPAESLMGKPFEEHVIVYDTLTGEYSCHDDDKVAQRLISRNKEQLDIIAKKIMKFRPLNESVSYETYNEGKIIVPINGDTQFESLNDMKNACQIKVPVSDLPKSIKRAYRRGKKVEKRIFG